MPTADDLFRPTAEAQAAQHTAQHTAPHTGQHTSPQTTGQTAGERLRRRPVAAVPNPGPEPGPESSGSTASSPASRRSSGRIRHDEKMTVYVTAEELLDIEHARLALRRDQGLAIDRGRLVREAISIVLADLEAEGDHSMLVRRLAADDA